MNLLVCVRRLPYEKSLLQRVQALLLSNSCLLNGSGCDSTHAQRHLFFDVGHTLSLTTQSITFALSLLSILQSPQPCLLFSSELFFILHQLLLAQA